MNLFVIALGLLFVVSASGLVPPLSTRKDGLVSRNTTCAINGLFIMIVFLSHLRQYIPQESYGAGDQVYLWVMKNLGQLMVATFLFFSGYGVLESIRRKGSAYVYSLPSARVMPYLLDVWIALIPYLCIRIYKHIPVKMEDFLSAMVGWKGIGNSNWYILAILCMYLATYFSFRLAKGRMALGCVGVTLACAAYCKLMIVQGAGTWYYNTIFCYPAGMVFSMLYRKVLDAKWDKRYTEVLSWIVLAVAVAAFIPLHKVRNSRSIVFNVCAIVFVLAVIFALRKAPANGKAFNWLGHRLFFAYIYQRIPMILLSRYAAAYTVPYAAACLVVTLLLTAFMPEVHARIKAWLYAKP